MPTNTLTSPSDRVTERRSAVALAHHYRDFEGVSIAQIAGRLGRSPATIKAYFYDPSAEKARAVKARYQGLCRAAARTRSRGTGRGTPTRTARCATRVPSSRRWTLERVLDAMREWRARYGRLPSSYDWSRTHAHRCGGEPLERLSAGDWPSASAVTGVYGSWKAARAAAAKQLGEAEEGERPSPDRPS